MKQQFCAETKSCGAARLACKAQRAQVLGYKPHNSATEREMRYNKKCT